MALFDLKIHFCKSSLRSFCSVLMMSKRRRLNVSHEGSLRVHIRAARHVSLWESITRVLCQVGNVSQRRDQICGGGSFLLCWLESKVSPCHVMSCHVMSCRVMSCHREGVEPHSDCNLDSKVREGSGKTLCSASGSFWLILKTNEILEQGEH